ncbi:MAG: hypothetical protein IJQ50_01550, partial [Clostridia bacterium]|nr:hypothetical protein [Clostridia bacterium]
MTFEEKFNELKKELIKADVKKFDNDFAIQITMNDDDCGGTFYAAYINKEYSVEPFDYFDNTASIDTSAEVISDIISIKTD